MEGVNDMFNLWKAQPVEFPDMDHGYSLVSDYYVCRKIRGVLHYRITLKGLLKLIEKQLNMETHNFMVYLAGHGSRLISEHEFENGDIR